MRGSLPIKSSTCTCVKDDTAVTDSNTNHDYSVNVIPEVENLMMDADIVKKQEKKIFNYGKKVCQLTLSSKRDKSYDRISVSLGKLRHL